MQKSSLSILFVLFCFNYLFAQETIRGQILDEEGYGLIGANVEITEAKIGVATDYDGNFSLSVPVEYTRPYNLTVSYVGYTSQTITIDDSMGNILKPIILKDNFNDCNVVLLIYVFIPTYIFPAILSGSKSALHYIPSNLNQSTNAIAPLNEMSGIRVLNDGFNSSNIISRGNENQKLNIESVPYYLGAEENIIEDLEPNFIKKVTVDKTPNIEAGAVQGGAINLTARTRYPFFSSSTNMGSNGFFKTSNMLSFEHERRSDCLDSDISFNHSYTQSDGFRGDNYQKHSFTILGSRGYYSVYGGKDKELRLFAHYSKVKKGLPGPLDFEAISADTNTIHPNWQSRSLFDNHESGIFGLSKTFEWNRFENTNTIFGTFNKKDRYVNDFSNFETYTWGGKTVFEYRGKHGLPLEVKTGAEFYQEENLWTVFNSEDLESRELLNQNKDHKTYFDWFVNGDYKFEKWNDSKLSAGLNINKTILKRVDLFDGDQKDNNQIKEMPPMLSPSLGFIFPLKVSNNLGLGVNANVNHGFTRTPTGSTFIINETTEKIIDPTYGWNYEIGFTSNWKKWKTNLTLYTNQINGLYLPVYFNNEDPIAATQKGIEFSTHYETQQLQIFAAYSYNHHRFKNQSITAIPGTTPHHFNLGLLYRTADFGRFFNQLNFRLNYELIGTTAYDFLQVNTTQPSHLLQAKITFDKDILDNLNIEFNLGANNILNQKYISKYQTNTQWQLMSNQANYYPGMPFHFYGGVKLSLRELPSKIN